MRALRGMLAGAVVSALAVMVPGGWWKHDETEHARIAYAPATIRTPAMPASTPSCSTPGGGPPLSLAVSGGASGDSRRSAAAAVSVDAQGDGEIVVCSTGAAQIAGPGAARVVQRCG